MRQCDRPGGAAAAVTRFAPSPTGHLHLGHAFAALWAEDAARRAGGRFLVRIEDIDAGRCRPQFESAIIEDLGWLGLRWEEPVRRQSEHMEDYAGALEKLQGMGVLYPCFCTRKAIQAEIARAGQAPHGPDGALYPGTCRRLDGAERRQRAAEGQAFALRLDTKKACAAAGALTWTDLDKGSMRAEPGRFGDVVLARKDTPTSYHLAVTVDDHLQGVSLVTRGEDLLQASHVHRLLQALLGLDTPTYQHHRLVTGADGGRLAKRHRAATIRALREAGKSPDAVRAMTGFE